MGEQFEYMVTPLVFDLELNFKSDDYEIAKVYGSDTVNEKTGNIINVNTLKNWILYERTEEDKFFNSSIFDL